MGIFIALYKKHLALVEEMPTEGDVRRTREELDQKYPFEAVDDMITAPEEEIEEDVKIAKPAEKPVQEAPTEPIRPELKRENPNKFDKLQFGDNYDV